MKNSEDRTLQQVEGLKRLAQIINSHSSQDQTLEAALGTVAEAVGAERCLLWRYDLKTRCAFPLTPAFGFNSIPNQPLQIDPAANSLTTEFPETNLPPLAQAFQKMRPLLINENYPTNSSLVGEDLAPLHERNAAIVPVQVDGHLLGFCTAFAKKEGAFDEDDLETLEAFSSLLATLLNNLNLVERLEGEQRRHLAVLDATVDGFIEVSRDYRITTFSKGAENLTGWRAEEALGRTCSEVLLPHSAHNEQLCFSCPLRRSFRQNESITNVESLIRTRDGEDNWVSFSYNVVSDQQGEVVSGVIAIKDIYRIKALGDELRQQIRHQQSLLGVINAINGLRNIEEIYSKALGEIANAINFDLGVIHSIKDNQELDLRAIYEPNSSSKDELRSVISRAVPTLDDDLFLLNPVAPLEVKANEETFYRQSEWLNQHRRPEPNAGVRSGRNYFEQASPRKTVNSCEALRQNEPYMAVNFPDKGICKVLDGFEGIQAHLCVPIKTKERNFGVLHLASRRQYAFWGSDFALALSICKQIAVAAERANLFEQIDLLARTDTLTQLYNKREFWERIEIELKRADSQNNPMSLVIFDLDKLKWYNDFYGHSHGDLLLSRIGELVLEKSRNTDIAFRFGGDELCLLLPGTNAVEAQVVAERIRKGTIELQQGPEMEQDQDEEEENRVTMSIGIASYPLDSTSAVELFEKADSAMYRAKTNGKNRSFIYDSEIDSSVRRTRQAVKFSEYVDERLRSPRRLKQTAPLRLGPK